MSGEYVMRPLSGVGRAVHVTTVQGRGKVTYCRKQTSFKLNHFINDVVLIAF